jgi:hypothetical protein
MDAVSAPISATIKTMIRCRPLPQGKKPVVSADTSRQNTMTVTHPSRNVEQEFQFDELFNGEASQEQVCTPLVWLRSAPPCSVLPVWQVAAAPAPPVGARQRRRAAAAATAATAVGRDCGVARADAPTSPLTVCCACRARQVFDNACKPLVDHVLDGYNSCCFAYGQTGSGKTYSIFGEAEDGRRGIVPRAMEQVRMRTRGVTRGLHRANGSVRA